MIFLKNQRLRESQVPQGVVLSRNKIIHFFDIMIQLFSNI